MIKYIQVTEEAFKFYFFGSFLPSWTLIRIPNPDPLTLLNPDPIRIRNPDLRYPFAGVSDTGESKKV
jgi:hypothetical protein